MKICTFDPSLWDNENKPSRNLGDLIISEAIERELKNLFADADLVRIHTHTPITDEELQRALDCSLIFLSGSNILGAGLAQWPIQSKQKIQLARVIVFGVGWHMYEDDKPILRYLRHKFFLNLLLSKRFTHSVRDEYSKRQLQKLGIKNVLNTGCPTMWPLADIDTQTEIPRQKADNVLVMLTDYRKEPKNDRKLLKLLMENYEQVFFWPQGSNDLKYFKTLNCQVNVLDRSLETLTQFLNSGIQLDYIGTRLHGGIKCLLAKKRALVLKIDNRATEIALDTGLPTCDRSDLETIERWITQPSATKITMDKHAIDSWKAQFKTPDNYQNSKLEKQWQSYLVSKLMA